MKTILFSGWKVKDLSLVVGWEKHNGKSNIKSVQVSDVSESGTV